MKQIGWKDEDGRQWTALLPDDADDSDAPLGILQGPPSFEALGLPEAVAVRLHNELYWRGVVSESDARRRRPEIAAALMAALKVDADVIVGCYARKEKVE